MKNIIFNYHDFKGLNKTFSKSNYTIDFEMFKTQLDSLKKIKNIPLLSILNPDFNDELTFSLTFDDGFSSSLNVAEELKFRDISGTFYIITDSINQKNYLSKKEILLISEMGMEIGSHSCSHRHLNRLNISELKYELDTSKKIIEDIIGNPVESLAFPGGMGGNREVATALNCGYKICGSTIPGLNNLPAKEGSVNRINIKDHFDINRFEKLKNLNNIEIFKLKSRYTLLALPKYVDSKYKKK